MKKVTEIAAAKSSRIRRSPEQWQAIVAAQVSSGQNVSTYCRASGLCAVTLAKWRKRLVGELGAPMAPNAAPPSSFIELANSVRPLDAGVKIRIELGAGVVLELSRA
jgi:transposase-like protein